MMERSIQQWKQWDQETVGDLIDLFNSSKKSEGLVQKRIAEQQSVTEQSFSKWLNRESDWQWIKLKRYQLLVDLLATRGILGGHTAQWNFTEYLGLASFFGQDDRKLSDLIRNAQGHYVVYRYSNYKRGSILRGRLEIAEDNDHRMLTTAEFYRASVDDITTEWPRSGYFLARDNNQYAIFSRKNGINEPQIIYIKTPMPTNRQPHPEEFSNMEGIIADWQGAEFYFTPVFIVKVNSQLQDDQICDLNPRNIDPVIAGKLAGKITMPLDPLFVFK